MPLLIRSIAQEVDTTAGPSTALEPDLTAAYSNTLRDLTETAEHTVAQNVSYPVSLLLI